MQLSIGWLIWKNQTTLCYPWNWSQVDNSMQCSVGVQRGTRMSQISYKMVNFLFGWWWDQEFIKMCHHNVVVNEINWLIVIHVNCWMLELHVYVLGFVINTVWHCHIDHTCHLGWMMRLINCQWCVSSMSSHVVSW